MQDAPIFDAAGRPDAILDDPSDLPVAFRRSRSRGVPIADPPRTGRRPSASEKQAAGEPTPLQQEFDSGRLPAFLRETAEVVAALFEATHRQPPSPARVDTAAPGRLVGPEVTVRARQVLTLVRCRTGHLYRDLIAAAVFGASMRDIGMRHGGNANDAAKIGREKVRDGLLFALAALNDLERWGRAQDRAVRQDAPPPSIRCRALGFARDIPAAWLRAANDDLRRLAA